MKRLLSLAAMLVASPAWAQTATLPPTLQKVGIEQRLGAQVPRDLAFQNHAGETVTLADLDSGRPVVLALVYYECPMLCTMVLNGVLRVLNTLELDVGRDFDVLTVSIDPKETPKLAAAKREKYLSKYRRPTAPEGWHFLVGDETNVGALADAVGFHYAWDDKTQQYAHASGIMVLTPDGDVAQYLFGVDYDPRVLRLSLVEASRGEVGTLSDAVLLYCFQYDPATGKYSLAIMNVLRAGAALTLLALALLIGILLLRERRARTALVTS